MVVALWIRRDDGAEFLIRKDPNGYPDLVPVSPQARLSGSKKEEALLLYRALTGKEHPYLGATTRQILWDFIEAATGHLP